MNKKKQRNSILRFLKGIGSRNEDAFDIYQWIERCHFEEWWDLALKLAPNVPANSLPLDYHKRLDFLLRESSERFHRKKKDCTELKNPNATVSFLVPNYFWSACKNLDISLGGTSNRGLSLQYFGSRIVFIEKIDFSSCIFQFHTVNIEKLISWLNSNKLEHLVNEIILDRRSAKSNKSRLKLSWEEATNLISNIVESKNIFAKSEPRLQDEINYKHYEKNLNFLGHRVGSLASEIDILLLNGVSISDAAKTLGTTEGRIGSHIYHLKREKNLEIQKIGNVYRLIRQLYLQGRIRSLAQTDSSGWLRREIIVERDKITGYPNINDNIQLIDFDGEYYELTFVKGANVLDHVCLGQPGILKRWFLKYYPSDYVTQDDIYLQYPDKYKSKFLLLTSMQRVQDNKIHRFSVKTEKQKQEPSFPPARLQQCRNFEDLKHFLENSSIPTNHLDCLTLRRRSYEDLVRMMRKYRARNPQFKDFRTLTRIKSHIRFREQQGWCYFKEGDFIQLVDYRPSGNKISERSEKIKSICDRFHQNINNRERLKFPFPENKLPNNGVCIFFEYNEIAHGTNRVVLVNTHNAKNQLTPRVKEHFLNENKDRSILRKHIGRCLLNRDNDPFLDNWEMDLTSKEAKHLYAGRIDLGKQMQVEKKVTKYLRENLSLVAIEVEDKSTRLKLRSKIVSTVSLCNGCRPSSSWLGNYSPEPKIRESGLWQVQGLYKKPSSDEELDDLGL